MGLPFATLKHPKQGASKVSTEDLAKKRWFIADIGNY